MTLPPWYVAIAQPARWTVGGAIGLGSVGALGGLVEAIWLYPISSWFGVTLFVAMLAALVGTVLGLVGALVVRPS